MSNWTREKGCTVVAGERNKKCKNECIVINITGKHMDQRVTFGKVEA